MNRINVVLKMSVLTKRLGVIKINTLNGNTFAQMIISGANNLYNNRKTVDELNVFPVPDGDTGTNMSLTATAMATELLKKRQHNSYKSG